MHIKAGKKGKKRHRTQLHAVSLFIYIDPKTDTDNYSCAFFLCSKQALQYTGLSLEGWKVILASPPQSAHTAVKYSATTFSVVLAFGQLLRTATAASGYM